MSNPSRSMAHSASAIENFGNFYEIWLTRQREFLKELLHVLQIEEHEEEKQLGVINQVLAHYQNYHEEISKAAGEDVFRVFSAPWLSSYERTLLWISGFKPSIVFRLVDGAVKDLTAVQVIRVEELKAEVRRKERDLTEALASLQETVAAPPIVGLARRAGRLVDGEICEMENAIEELKIGMLGVFDSADLLRGSTMKRVMEILRTDQTVRLLAAATEFQLRIRRWGLQRDMQGTRTT
ncbi:protein DOG1-like 4 [Cucurbita moschata]|uniref:Protein DOG1-like 4 n=1 Tax=Cucurbita moschata TaxID=3662 RepID=A0A6J1HE23_CUCMO|nr:protein DOG1-like 4 [Cucurbita moschata]